MASWLSPLESGGLCETAQRRTGLQDFGYPPLEPALSILLKSLSEEAELHPLGRVLLRMHLLDLLKTRLRLEQIWNSDAEILAAERIVKPLFIVGMPRSGSTFLHELLAADPDHRAPRVWEVMFPFPGLAHGQTDVKRRIRRAAFCLWCFRQLVPRADAVCPMRALTPQECVAIQSYTLLSREFVATSCIPAYEAILHRTDLTPAYVWEKRFLQHLQVGGARKRWVLKSPDHVFWLKELFAVFPDALIIHTHRNPVEAVKSAADLTRVLLGLFGSPGRPSEIRAREARILAQGTERIIHFRDAHPELADQFVDVKYGELVTDPLAAVRHIYDWMGTSFTESIAARVRHLASNRSRYRGPRASADPSNLEPESVWETNLFERYCSRFGIPSQNADLKR